MAFKMKGHALPGIKQRAFEDDSIINSAPRKYETQNGVKAFKDTTKEDGRAASAAFQMKSAFKQTDSDLKEFLMSDKGFSQEDADRMINDGAYDLNNSEFKAWYAESGKGDVDGDVTPMEYTKSALKSKKRGAYSAHNYAHGSLGDESDGAHNDPNWQEHLEAGEQRRKKLMSELDFEDDTKS